MTVRRAEPALDDHPHCKPCRRPLEARIALLRHHDERRQRVLKPQVPTLRRRLDDREASREQGAAQPGVSVAPGSSRTCSHVGLSRHRMVRQGGGASAFAPRPDQCGMAVGWSFASWRPLLPSHQRHENDTRAGHGPVHAGSASARFLHRPFHRLLYASFRRSISSLVKTRVGSAASAASSRNGGRERDKFAADADLPRRGVDLDRADMPAHGRRAATCHGKR